MQNIVILISGRGSNLDAILAAARREAWMDRHDARVAAVISNRPQAGGLAVAQAQGIPTEVVDHTSFAGRESFDAALAARIDAHSPRWVLLAGFMRVLTTAFVQRYEGRLVNIHPSLLPSFPGLATHRQALAAGVRVHGATVHFVSAAVDAGAILGQAVVPVAPDDDEASLAARVLEQEHRLYPRVLEALLAGAARFESGRVALDRATAASLTLVNA
jgi:phosphoribosylglycinamide formyltransferase-1